MTLTQLIEESGLPHVFRLDRYTRDRDDREQWGFNAHCRIDVGHVVETGIVWADAAQLRQDDDAVRQVLATMVERVKGVTAAESNPNPEDR